MAINYGKCIKIVYKLLKIAYYNKQKLIKNHWLDRKSIHKFLKILKNRSAERDLAFVVFFVGDDLGDEEDGAEELEEGT